MFSTIVSLALIALLVIFGILFAKQFATAQGDIFSRILAAGRNSATIAWQRFVIIISTAAASLSFVADYFNAPGVSDAIKSVLKPEYVAAFVVGVALISELARRRSL